MTTLLPWLDSLQGLDKCIASRFACYASTILEHCMGHPVVLFEGSVFFERLSAYRSLIEPSCCCVVNTDNTATVAIPFLLSALKPPVAKVVANKSVDFNGCHGPIDAQRSAVMCLKGVFASEIKMNSLAFDVGKSILEFLHDRCGRRRFEHFSEFRSLALPRSVANYFEDCQLIETETIALVHAVLAVQLDIDDLDEKTYLCLQWLLCSVSVISGDSLQASKTEPDIELSISGLIERSSWIARSNASPIVNVSNPPRWQLKCICANIASLTMTTLLEMHENASIFNLQSAKARCLKMLQKENNNVYGVSLHSFPVLHLEELVTTACIASAATSNNSEIPSVQSAGLRFLITVLKAFGEELDASTNDGTTVLEQYSSQIISAVRHALNAETLLEDTIVTGSGFHRLFATGCDALFVMIERGFVSEPVVIRRLLQPLLLTSEDVPFATFGGNDEKLLMKSNQVTDDSRSFPLFRLSKLCFVARVSMMIEMGDTNQSTVSVISSELKKEGIGRAVHSAAAAVDGFLLHKAQALLTRGLPSTGLTFANLSDVDESIVNELMENWPVLAASAFVSITKAIKNAHEESEQRESLKLWLSKLLPIVLVGLRDALSEFKLGQSGSSVSETAALFICALRLLIGSSISIEFCSDELGAIISMVTDSVLFQILGLSDSDSGRDHPSIPPQTVIEECASLMQQACGFIEDLCKIHSETGVTDLVLLTHSVMKPLVALQEKQIKLHANFSIIISSCIRSSVILLRCQSGDDRLQLEKALVQLSLSTLKDMPDYPNELSKELKEPCLSLLRSCSGDTTALKAEEWGDIANYSVSNELWDAWAIVCDSLPPGIGIKSSINAMKGALGDLESKSRHTGAIVALRAALHSTGTEDPSLVCFVLYHVGFEVLQLLRAYSLRLIPGQGFDENRVTVCAEAVKVNMIAFQYLSTTPGQEDTSTSFLAALFQVLVECVSFNGLPGNSKLDKRSHGADENLGRMCAQVFVHIARSNPLMFKATISSMAAASRTILENAVRADMSGYAAPKTEKKKLSLKGFR